MPRQRKRYLHLRDRHAAAVRARYAAEDGASGLLRQPHRAFAYLAAVDPTRNKACLQRLLHWYLAGRFRMEDARRVRATLETFRGHLRLLPVEARDLNRYGSPGDVDEALEGFRGGPGGIVAIADVPPSVMSETRVWASGENWRLIELLGYDASAWWARSTSWCTRHHLSYGHYAVESPLYVMVGPRGMVQFHSATNQMMDRFDRPTDPLAAGWPLSAMDAAAAAVARDVLAERRQDDAVHAAPALGNARTMLHMLARLPAARLRESRPSAVDFGDDVTSWVAVDGGTTHLVAVDRGVLHVRRLAGPDGSAEPCRREGYRSPQDWRAAPQSHVEALRIVARGVPGRPGLPAGIAVELAAVLGAGDPLLPEIMEGGGLADAALVARRLDLLSCAAGHPALPPEAVAGFAGLLASQGMADAVATSLTALAHADDPVVGAVTAKASAAARRVVGALEIATLAVHPRLWSEANPAQDPDRASDDALDRHFFGESQGRLRHYRFLRTRDDAGASQEDLLAVLGNIRDAVGYGYRHFQRGYLVACLPPDRRDADLFTRLLDEGHRGLAAAAPLDQLPPELARRLVAGGETPVILDLATATPACAMTLAGLREAAWNEAEPLPAAGPYLQRAAAAFATTFLRHRRGEWARAFVRAARLAYGGRDLSRPPVDWNGTAGSTAAEPVPGHLVRADHLAGMVAAALDARGDRRDDYLPMAVDAVLLANPVLAEPDEGGRLDWVWKAGSPQHGEDLRAMALARDWRFVRRMTARDVHSRQWQFVIDRKLAEAWRTGDLQLRRSVARTYERLGLQLRSIAPESTGTEIRAAIEERPGAEHDLDVLDARDASAALLPSHVRNRFGPWASTGWLLRALAVAAASAFTAAARRAAR